MIATSIFLPIFSILTGSLVAGWQRTIDSDPYYNLHDVKQSPNITKTVPVMMEGVSWSFRINLTEIPAMGVNATENFDNPRVVLTTYDIQAPKNYTPKVYPGFATTYQHGYTYSYRSTYWLFYANTTNAYDADSPGQCSGVFEPKCLKHLEAKNSSSPSGPDWDSCAPIASRAGDGAGVYYQANDPPSQSRLFSGYISDTYEAGEDEQMRREEERLHVFMISGNDTTVVCARVKTDKLSKNDTGTGPPHKSEESGGGHLTPNTLLSLALLGGLAYFL